jgi:hypothetical protein
MTSSRRLLMQVSMVLAMGAVAMFAPPKADAMDSCLGPGEYVCADSCDGYYSYCDSCPGGRIAQCGIVGGSTWGQNPEACAETGANSVIFCAYET